MLAKLICTAQVFFPEVRVAGKMADFGFWLTRTFARTEAWRKSWPHVPGTYFVNNPSAPVAVCTLGSVDLAAQVAEDPPDGLCISGKVETENIGIEKIIKNLLANPAVEYLLCVGEEPPKHLTGATLQALFKNGIDEHNRIPESPGMRPYLPNTTPGEVNEFRNRLKPVFQIGLCDIAAIHAKVIELADSVERADGAAQPVEIATPISVERVQAIGDDPYRIKLDKGGYFVVGIVDGELEVEHYSYKEKLLRVIHGPDARSIYLTIVRNGWVTRLDHAAYLGKELAKAEISLHHKIAYVQDGA